jgi:carbonic anhydrase
MAQGTNPGDLFVHRNVANLVVNTDMNMLSVLTYAVEHLKVKHIVVCGHYNCGGVRAANATDVDLGVIEHWLRNVRDVKRLHMAELNSIVDDELRHRRLVELNVAEGCINLFKTGVVQEARMKTGYPLIHGLVYDLADGHLNTLNLDLLGVC